MANVTISTTSAQDERILAAFKDRFGPDTTGADVKAWLITQLKTVVHQYEAQLKIEEAVATITDIEPS